MIKLLPQLKRDQIATTFKICDQITTTMKTCDLSSFTFSKHAPKLPPLLKTREHSN